MKGFIFTADAMLALAGVMLLGATLLATVPLESGNRIDDLALKAHDRALMNAYQRIVENESCQNGTHTNARQCVCENYQTLDLSGRVRSGQVCESAGST